MRTPLPLALAVVGALTVTGCGSGPGGDGDQLRLVAGFYPLAYVAEQVGGSHVAVTNLAQPGAEAHDLELSPRQVAEVEQADLVVHLAGFQPGLDEAVTTYADDGFDVASAVPLLDTADGPADGQAPGGAGDDHGHDDHGHDDHGHGTDGTDPHLWLDPDRLATVGDRLADRLAELDPGRADAYAAGADRLRADLAALDAEFTAGLADCERRELVVSHAAFGYLADRYDLRQIAVTGLSPEDEPTPQRLAGVIRAADRHDVTTIFFERSVSPAVAEVIATELGATTRVLDPLASRPADSDRDYPALMRTNLAALRDGLGCA